MTAKPHGDQQHPAAFEMTEILPDGTRQFVFVSNRLLDMLGLERETRMRDWRSIYANIHPDDFAGFLKPSEESWNGDRVPLGGAGLRAG